MGAEKHIEQPDVKLLDAVKMLFISLHTGYDRAAKTNEILAELAHAGFAVGGNTLRDVVGYIRQHDLLSPGYILSDVHTGYWLSECETEQSDFIDKQLNRMANQYRNVKLLIQRNRFGKNKLQTAQAQLF